MTAELDTLKANYYTPEAVPMQLDSFLQRTYSLTPRYARGGVWKSDTAINLLKSAGYTRGRFFLDWTSDWGHQQFLGWVNSFIATQNMSGYHTRLDREVENPVNQHYATRLTNDVIRERAATTGDHGFQGYRLIVEGVSNGVWAYPSLIEEPYRRRPTDRLADISQNSGKLRASDIEKALKDRQANQDTQKTLADMGLFIGLDHCTFSYHPKGYNPKYGTRSFADDKAIVAMGDFDAEMLNPVIFAFIQSDVPEVEKFYFLDVLKQAIGHTAAESAKIFHLEDVRHPRLRRYWKPMVDLYGWDSGNNAYTRMSGFQVQSDENKDLLAEVIKTPNGPIIALELPRYCLLNQDYNTLFVDYRAQRADKTSTLWVTPQLSLQQIIEYLQQEGGLRRHGKFRLFISGGAIKGDFMNVLTAGGKIPEAIANLESIFVRFSRTRTFIGTSYDSNDRKPTIQHEEIPSMGIHFSTLLEQH